MLEKLNSSLFRSKQQRVTHLLNMGIAEPTVTKLLAVLEREGSVEHLRGVLKQMTKRKNQAASDIKQGIVINQLCSFLNVCSYDGYNALL